MGLGVVVTVLFFATQIYAGTILEESRKSNINDQCLLQLEMISDYLKPDGANLTVVNPKNPENSASHHFSLKKGVNGSNAITINLIPTENKCNWSYSKVVSEDDKSCDEIQRSLEKIAPNLKVALDQQDYKILLNPDTGAYIFLTERGKNSCTALETASAYP